MLQIRALTGKEWGSETWNRISWLYSDKKKLTLLKPQVTLIPLPVEVSCPLIAEETSFSLLENSMLTSSGTDALKGDVPFQDPPQPVLVAISLCVHAKSLQSCPTFCKPMDCSLPGSSVHEIL